MRLFIAEKPSLGRAIAHGLGAGKEANGCIEIGNDTVTWCFGHILRQYEPNEYDENLKKWRMEDLPIVPDVWKLKVAKDSAAQFKIIKELVAKADEIVNAGDPDREGQLLVDEVLEQLGNRKPVKRILLNALDEKSVKQALNDLRENSDFQGLKNSALGRSRADWLLGMNLSRAYTLRARQAGYENTAISVGRVQTPTMALVVRREAEIENFKPVNYFTVQGIFKHGEEKFSAAWLMPDDLTGLDSEGRLIDRAAADSLLQKLGGLSTAQGKISAVQKSDKQEPQRLTYSLSDLQIEAGKIYGYSPQQVLDTMQDLYEKKKLTSYPRSDCAYLPENQLADVETILGNLAVCGSEEIGEWAQNADKSIRSRVWNDKKISAHHAIIPTRNKADFSALSDMEQNMYSLVAKAHIAQFYPVHTYQTTQIEVEFGGEKFVAKGRTVTEVGWKSLYKNSGGNEQDEPTFPAVVEGDTIDYIEGKISSNVTKPPTHYTPSSLLKEMKDIHKHVRDPKLKAELKECSGIGTEATRAGIIEEIQKKGFLVLSKKFLVPTDIGKLIVKILPPELTYPDTTAIWEEKLSAVEKGELSYDEFERGQVAVLDEFLEQAKNVKLAPPANVPLCPNCGKAMHRRQSTKNKGEYFWSCSGYPDCKTTAQDVNGKILFDKDAPKCPTCGKPMHRRQSAKKKGEFFWSCTGYPDCKTTAPDTKGKPDFKAVEQRAGCIDRQADSVSCPDCGKPMMRRKSAKGNYWWGCSGYPDCKTIAFDENGKPKFK